MYPELHCEILKRLKADYDFKKQSGEFLQQGKCPNCGKREFYTHQENPWVLRCGRLNKCGLELHIKDVYPDLFNSWSERFPIVRIADTDKAINLHATADAYLSIARGFDLKLIEGWYQQSSYYSSELKAGTATVKFQLGNRCSWERFIDNPERFGNMKANFIGRYKGWWWQAPNFDIERLIDSQCLWITEGIFDAIALLHIDVMAVSAMSCHNFPELALNALEQQLVGKQKPTLVFAFDSGIAGEMYTRVFVKKAKELGWTVTAAQPPKKHNVKLDWNELLIRGSLNNELLKHCLYLGELLLAETAMDKASLIHKQKVENEFSFVFKNNLYWFKFDTKQFERAYKNHADEKEVSERQLQQAKAEATSIQLLAQCHPHVLYFQKNLTTKESWYYFRVDFPFSDETVKDTFTGKELACSHDFKKRLLDVAPGALFIGDNYQLNTILREQFYQLKNVKLMDYTGYHPEYRCYVFKNVAVKAGKLYYVNAEDYFDINRLCIKSQLPVSVTLNADFNDYQTQWVEQIWQAFSEKGLIALAFWFGSFFAEQIRERCGSYPFLEISGEPGTGKTTLLVFLWRLAGRDRKEGFDPSKSTAVGVYRSMEQVSNLPVVFIEGDRKEDKDFRQKRFHWDELKNVYDGQSIRSKGVCNSGNETYEPPFKGSVIIAQNAELKASEAIMERIVQLHFAKGNQTNTSRIAVEELKRTRSHDVSGFMLKSILKEKELLEAFDEKLNHYTEIVRSFPEVKEERIILNHGQMHSLLEVLSLVVPLNEHQLAQTHAYISQLAIKRQQSLSSDHPMVEAFWDVYEFLEGDNDKIVNHAIDDKIIAINLNQFVEEAVARKQSIPSLIDLKQVLPFSHKYKYVEHNKTVKSAVHRRLKQQMPNLKLAETKKCWIFKLGE